jgi:hypothetical protein
VTPAEIRVTARLQHAHILPLLDSGMLETAPGITYPFYVMTDTAAAPAASR